jgi:ribosomal RNA-processing protein 12
MGEDHHRDVEAEPFKDGADICQQLMDRYSKSSASQHHHLLATAAAMRSILAAESLPLTAPAYFAATISAIDDMSSSSSGSQTTDPTAVAALLSFLALVLPVVPPRSISSAKAGEALSMLVELLEREEGLTMTCIRSVVKCLGALVGFCDLEDWESFKLGLQTLLKFSVDKRPKVAIVLFPSEYVHCSNLLCG